MIEINPGDLIRPNHFKCHYGDPSKTFLRVSVALSSPYFQWLGRVQSLEALHILYALWENVLTVIWGPRPSPASSRLRQDEKVTFTLCLDFFIVILPIDVLILLFDLSLANRVHYRRFVADQIGVIYARRHWRHLNFLPFWILRGDDWNRNRKMQLWTFKDANHVFVIKASMLIYRNVQSLLIYILPTRNYVLANYYCEQRKILLSHILTRFQVGSLFTHFRFIFFIEC